MGFPSGTVVKNLPANAGEARDAGSIPGLGRPPAVGGWQPAPVWYPAPAWKILLNTQPILFKIVKIMKNKEKTIADQRRLRRHMTKYIMFYPGWDLIREGH